MIKHFIKSSHELALSLLEKSLNGRVREGLAGTRLLTHGSVNRETVYRILHSR